jgi:hypothetical protein
MITTAWYDLTSRLQSNHVVLQRRHDAPRSWLNKQRQMVNGEFPPLPSPSLPYLPFLPLLPFVPFQPPITPLLSSSLRYPWTELTLILTLMRMDSHAKEVVAPGAPGRVLAPTSSSARILRRALRRGLVCGRVGAGLVSGQRRVGVLLLPRWW